MLHVVRTDGLSGAEGHLVALVAPLAAQGWSSDVLISTRDPEGVQRLVRRLGEEGAGVRVIVGRHDLHPALLRSVLKARRSSRWSLIHSHMVHADWHAGLAALLTRGSVPLVSTKHNHDPFRTKLAVRAIETLWGLRTAQIIAISGSLADFIERHGTRRPVTVRYGISAGPAPAVRKAGRSVRLIAVGRLEPQKGVDVLLDAVARVEGVELDIVGDGSLRSTLADQVERLGLADRVRLVGHQQDVPDRMRAADVFVHAARWEGFGLVLLEAMSAGLPVVATSVGAIPEVVDDGVTGVLVAPDQSAALADAIRSLVADPERRRELGDAGRARLLEAFAVGRMARETADVYDCATGVSR
ncbi:MAG: glycosyltransferase family 4 protein [Solirubrobacteraceae bacterium]|nr:glycosyltransferase family 4 protein [Solirubrobacteraceae bacterium]